MRTPFTTKMSSRGQVVIPQQVRKNLNFQEGTPFLVVARKDTIVLYRLQEPPWEFLDDFDKQAARQGRAHDQSMRAFRDFLHKMRYGR